MPKILYDTTKKLTERHLSERGKKLYRFMSNRIIYIKNSEPNGYLQVINLADIIDKYLIKHNL